MSRFKPDPIVRDDDWDLDESATLRGQYGYLELQRIGFSISTIQEQPNTEDGAREGGLAMARVLMQIYRSITLRKPETPYKKGVDRPKYDFTEEALLEQPMDTLSFLLRVGMEHVAQSAPKTPETVITDEARGQGLTPTNFPANGAGEGVLLAGEV